MLTLTSNKMNTNGNKSEDYTTPTRDNNNGGVFHSRHNRTDMVANERKYNDKNGSICEYPNNNVINIYRYKFSQELIELIFAFSKIHEHDNRVDFKEAWERWIEENDELINNEVERLTKNGYKGNVMDKLYKSARYYYRKKGTEKKAPIGRRKYQSLNKDLIKLMDDHINESLQENDFKPSTAFTEFCGIQSQMIKEQIDTYLGNSLSREEVTNKIKKTYKNRYFIQINKNEINK